MIRCETLVDHLILFLVNETEQHKYFRRHVGHFAVNILHDRVLADPLFRPQIRIGADSAGNQWKALAKIAFENFFVTIYFTFFLMTFDRLRWSITVLYGQKNFWRYWGWSSVKTDDSSFDAVSSSSFQSFLIDRKMQVQLLF